MAKPSYRVCWWHEGAALPAGRGEQWASGRRAAPTCRTLSAKQHRNRREAAETVLMQNPHATVKVWGGKGTHSFTYRKRAGQVRRVG